MKNNGKAGHSEQAEEPKVPDETMPMKTVYNNLFFLFVEPA